jgi:probable HAF family extracellular repeat protein
MPNTLLRLATLTTVLTATGLFAPAHAASFQGIGDIAGGSFQSTAQGISADGLTVVGQGQGATSANVAVTWTAATGIKALYSTTTSGVANKAGANGNVVVGRDDSFGARAYRYGGSLGFVGGLNPAGSPPNQGRSWSISNDGATVVGSVASPASTAGEQAFRYTSAGGLVPMGFLGSINNNGVSHLSEARDVSGNGSVIVGFSSSAVGQSAFRWTAATGMTDLGRLSGDTSNYVASAVSTDGNVIVGYSLDRGGFAWTQVGGLKALSGFTTAAKALDVNADGSVIVGSDKVPTNGNTLAVYWRNGVEFTLKDYLIAQGNTTVAGWDLRVINGISDDGLTVVGTGIDPAGFTEGFVASISAVPEPSSATLFAVGVLGAGLLVRRRTA